MADARREVEQYLEQFALQCAEAGVAAKLLEDVGLPADEIVLERNATISSCWDRRPDTTSRPTSKVTTRLRRFSRAALGRSLLSPRCGTRGGWCSLLTTAASGGPHPRRIPGDGAGRNRTGSDPDREHRHRSEHCGRNAEAAVDYLRFHEIRAEPYPLSPAARRPGPPRAGRTRKRRPRGDGCLRPVVAARVLRRLGHADIARGEPRASFSEPLGCASSYESRGN